MEKNDYSNEKLTIIAVGGGGRNIAESIQRLSDDKAIDFIYCRTDMGTYSSVENQIDIQNPSDSAEIESNIKPYLNNIKKAIVIASLGGTTGTEMTPLLLNILHQNNISTSCIVTMPFAFERRQERALVGLAKIQETGTMLSVFENETLKQNYKDMAFRDAFNYLEKNIAALVFEQCG
jgi:cell division GTPase FtsZ